MRRGVDESMFGSGLGSNSGNEHSIPRLKQANEIYSHDPAIAGIKIFLR